MSTRKNLAQATEIILDLITYSYDGSKTRPDLIPPGSGIPKYHVFTAVLRLINQVEFEGIIEQLKESDCITEINHVFTLVPGWVKDPHKVLKNSQAISA